MQSGLRWIAWFGIGVLAVLFSLNAGFYGWAGILVWSALVLPLAWRERRRARRSGRVWPARWLLATWTAALLAAVVTGAGFILLELTYPVAPTWAGWLIVVAEWAGLPLAVVTLVMVTCSATVGDLRTRKGAT